MKIYGTHPEQNQMADLEPARYFNLAIAQIDEIQEWMRTASDGSQPLLVHIDMFVYLSKRYPDMARRRIQKIDVTLIRQVFNDWYERSSKKIPTQFREGIKASADGLFDELDRLKEEA